MASDLATQLGLPSDAFPVQGKWSEQDYFRIEAERFVEFVNGRIEKLPMPTWLHHAICDFLIDQLKAWNKEQGFGRLVYAPTPLKLFDGVIREPDIFIVPKPAPGVLPRYPGLPLFVLEVVSEGSEDRKRDYIDKRADYAKAGIPEYWIVDPFEKAVTVLKLNDSAYQVHGRFENDAIAAAATLDGFSVNCGEIWALERQE